MINTICLVSSVCFHQESKLSPRAKTLRALAVPPHTPASVISALTFVHDYDDIDWYARRFQRQYDFFLPHTLYAYLSMLAFAAAGSSASWCCPCWNIEHLLPVLDFTRSIFSCIAVKISESWYTCGKREPLKSHYSARKSPLSKLSHFWSTRLFNGFDQDDKFWSLVHYYDYFDMML